MLVLAVLAASGSAEAAGSAEARWQALEQHLRLAQTDRAAWQAILAQGEDRAFFCAYCHGRDGNSVMPLVPNLAGQNPYYLLEQIERFANGEREDYIMSPLARQLSADERLWIALYYSSRTVRPTVVEVGLAERGRSRYENLCRRCHGPEARGSERYARLAGQRLEYLRHRLFQFQQPTATPTVMHGIAATLTPEDIEAITAYLAALP